MNSYAEKTPLVALSEAMAEAVAFAGAGVVTVDARRRLPASGIAYAVDLVLTADHVIEREDDIYIGLPDGSQHPAAVASRDPGSDLALLRLSTPLANLKTAAPAARDARIGELVLALGRPSKEGIQASLGVISAANGPLRTGRGGLLESYLRTDTTFYPGFSGGPLINASGEVLGLNTSGLVPGFSLTVPASLAWRVAEALASHGRVRRGYLGIRTQKVRLAPVQQKALGREQSSGLLLFGVEEGSPAEQGGLLVGDILVALGGQPVADHDTLFSRLVGGLVGLPQPVEVLRGGQPFTLTVRIGDRE